MEIVVRGWNRIRRYQRLFQRPLREVEHRYDGMVIPHGCTYDVLEGIKIAFQTKGIVLGPTGEYMVICTFTDADLAILVKRRFGIDLHQGPEP